jgi:hypothetical protein
MTAIKFDVRTKYTDRKMRRLIILFLSSLNTIRKLEVIYILIEQHKGGTNKH